MDNKQSKELSRRDAMKVLAAVAGAAALANIPAKWSKPGMEFGVLPAHAQTSTSIPLHTLVAGADDPAANYCFDLASTATITPPTPGIILRYTIALSPGLVLDSPVLLTNTIPTDASGVASLLISVNQVSFNTGDTVTVTWIFENASDGVGSGVQVFTSAGSGC